MKRPNLFIVGAPKCGTTSLWRYLGQHPEIFMSPQKEPYFFGADLGKHRGPKTEAQYLKLFAWAREEKWLGEATPWYLWSQRAAREIYQFNPSSRIIAMLRNPVDMIYSLHSQRIYSAGEDITDFEEALAAEEDRRHGKRIPRYVRFLPGLIYTEVPRYCEQVKRYLDLFGRENVQAIIFDDFTSETAAVYRDTLTFLGVDSDFRLAHYRIFNPRRVARTRVLRAVAHVMRAVSLHMHNHLPVRLVPRWLGTRIYKGIVRLNSRYEKRPAMDETVRRRLQETFAPEVERLSELLGRDLTSWVRDSS